MHGVENNLQDSKQCCYIFSKYLNLYKIWNSIESHVFCKLVFMYDCIDTTEAAKLLFRRRKKNLFRLEYFRLFVLKSGVTACVHSISKHKSCFILQCEISQRKANSRCEYHILLHPASYTIQITKSSCSFVWFDKKI